MKKNQESGKKTESSNKMIKTPESVQKANKRDITKIVVFNVVNVILVVIILFLVGRLPGEAEKVKNLRSEEIAAQESSSIGVLTSELEKNSSKIQELKDVFVDENQFISFVTSIESIRSQGILSDVTFPVVNPVKDGSGHLGLPVSIVARGNQDQLNLAIEEVLNLPFLLRPVNVNLEVVNQTEQTYILRLGLFLYVDEEFSEN